MAGRSASSLPLAPPTTTTTIHTLPTQVPEFVAFTERLRCSHTAMVARTELLLLDLARAADSQPSSSSSKSLEQVLLEGLPKLGAASGPDSPWAQLRFNQDLATRPSWLPPPSELFPAAIADW